MAKFVGVPEMWNIVQSAGQWGESGRSTKQLSKNEQNDSALAKNSGEVAIFVEFAGESLVE